jgi:hypothetical protein
MDVLLPEAGIIEKKNNEPGFRVHLQSQCCGSGMFIPDPEFYPSRIPDLGSRIQRQQQKKGVKKNVLSYIFM